VPPPLPEEPGEAANTAAELEGVTAGINKADSIEDMVGTWRRIGMPRAEYHLFFEDGTYHCSNSLERLEDQPYCKGEFWFEGTHYFDKESRGECTSYSAGAYEIYLQPNGNLRFVLIEDECVARISYVTGLGGYEGSVEWEPVR
jgi:hypothetical protein